MTLMGTGMRVGLAIPKTGNNVMNLIEGEVIDYGAPEYVCNGQYSVAWISAHSLRVSYYIEKPEGKVATHHAIFDIDDLLATHEKWGEILIKLLHDLRRKARAKTVLFPQLAMAN